MMCKQLIFCVKAATRLHESALAAATVENYSYLQRRKIYKLQYENKYNYVYL